jgi:uncharacterized protein YegL
LKANTAAFAQSRAMSDSLSEKLTALSTQVNDKELLMLEPQSRPEEIQKIQQINGRIHTLDDATESVFSGFFKMIRQSPSSVERAEAPQALCPAVRISSNSSSPASRRDSLRVVTPIESRHRKRPQVMIGVLAA